MAASEPFSDGSRDLISLHDGTLLHTHGPALCEDSGEFCCLHNPSEHPLNDRPLIWRTMLGSKIGFMERVCDHGIGHPDPDSLAHLRRELGKKKYKGYALGVHGCDGCCLGRK